MSLSVVGTVGSILGVFFELYGETHSPEQIVWLLTFPSLFIGVGNFLVLPLSLVFGRRPVFFISTIGLCLATIGCAVSNSYSGQLAGRIIQGLTTGCTESVLPLILSDITFLHQRSTIYGYYWASQSLLSAVWGIVSSYEAIGISWRWFYGIYVIFIGVGSIIVFFLTTETKFKRPAANIDGQVVITDEFGVTRVLAEEELRDNLNLVESSHQLDANTPKKTYLQSLSLWSGKSPRAIRTILTCYLQMVESLTSPGVVFALLCAAIVLGCSVGMSLTYNTVLTTVYSWAAIDVGLINIGTIPACLLAMAYAGFLGDKITVWLAKRNDGVHIPEHRLILLIFPGIIGFGALFLYGATASNTSGNLTWWGPYMGWNIYQFTFVCMLIITTTFAAEVWSHNPGPAIVMVVGGKNLIAFGYSYGLTPMVSDHGYLWACGIVIPPQLSNKMLTFLACGNLRWDLFVGDSRLFPES